MASLPVVGGDDGTWGEILNQFLEVSLNDDGTLSEEAVQAALGESGVTPGVYGSATTVPQVTVNAEGLVTEVTSETITTPGLPSTGTAGAPTAGTWTIGTQAVDSTGRTWVCTVAGTPGTWVLSGTFVPSGGPFIADDATDNGPMFQAALNAGNNIQLPTGTTIIDTPVFDERFAGEDPIVISGSPGAVLKFGPNLPTVSGFFGGSFNPGDVTVQWAFFGNTLASALVTPSTANAWVASTSYIVGIIVQDGAGNLYSCTVAGYSGSSTPTWNTTAGGTTTDGSATWTCMGTNNAVDVGCGSVQRHSVTGGIVRFPRFVFRNITIDGGGFNTGVHFGNGCIAKFEDMGLQHFKIGQSWTGYSDGAYFGRCDCESPASAGTITGSWLVYPSGQGTSASGGDSIRFEQVKCNGMVYHCTALGFNTGITADSCIQGGFAFQNVVGATLRGWHTELGSTEANPKLLLDRSSVKVEQHLNEPNYSATAYWCEINDSTGNTSQATHLDLDGFTSQLSMEGIPGSTGFDSTRTPDIYIAAANPGMTIRQRNAQSMRLDITASRDPDSLVIGSAVSGITSAVANPTYPAAASSAALLAGDFILHNRNGSWALDVLDSLPGLRTYAPQATPTGISMSGVTGATPTISSIVTNGTIWTITFATAHGLNVNNILYLAGFTPSGYNGTFTVASVPSSTTVTVTNATGPGTITVTGTWQVNFNILGTLTYGTSYDYTVATIDDDGLLSAAAVDIAFVATLSGATKMVALLSAPATALIVWRAVGTTGTVLTAPVDYQILPASSTKMVLYDTGVNVNGRAWISSSVPVPNSSFATTTSKQTRVRSAGALLVPASATVLTATNATWPIPVGANVLEVTCIGGGGGGGGSAGSSPSQIGASGGGGAPGQVTTAIMTVGAATTLAVVVGGVGTGGAAGGINQGSAAGVGLQGGNSTVTNASTSQVVTGQGGGGGAAGANGGSTGGAGGDYGSQNANGSANTSGSPLMGGSGGNSNAGGNRGGAAIPYSGSGAGGGSGANAGTASGSGGAAGTLGGGVSASAAAGGGSPAGNSAAANSGAGGGGAGGIETVASTGAVGAAGGNGGTGYVIIKVVG